MSINPVTRVSHLERPWERGWYVNAGEGVRISNGTGGMQIKMEWPNPRLDPGEFY